MVRVLLLLLTQHWLRSKTPKHLANVITETTTYHIPTPAQHNTLNLNYDEFSAPGCLIILMLKLGFMDIISISTLT